MTSSTGQAQPAWDAPSPCWSEREFQARAAELAPDAEPLRFEVRKRGASYELIVRDKAVQTHRLGAQTCQALQQAALTLLKLGRSGGRDRPSARESAAKSDPRPEGPVQSGRSGGQEKPANSKAQRDSLSETTAQEGKENSSQAGQGLPTENSRALRVKKAATGPSPKKRRRRLGQWHLAGQGGVGLGAMPGAYALAGATLGWERKRWRVQGGPRAALGAGSPQGVDSSWRANFRLWGASAQACWLGRLTSLRFPLCGGIEGAALESWRSSQAPGPKKLWTLWWGANLRAGVELDVSERLFFQSFVEASLLPRRPSVEIEDGPRLCCGALTGGLQAGLGLRLGRSTR